VTVVVAPSACTPRPGVVASPRAGGGLLNVRITATPLNGQQSNPLQKLVFTRLQNARVTVNGQQIREGGQYDVPANTTAVDFAVERVTAGQPATVELTVHDGCGVWRTFVGGGTGAGF
jgi:hypothetical protein